MLIKYKKGVSIMEKVSSVNVSKNKNIYRLVAIGLMSALVYVGNFMSIPLANDTRIHFGNSMCLLAGLLFGGVSGGISSGIGGALYDLFSPIYITSAPYTFFSKFAMGWTTGMLNRSKINNEFLRAVISAIIGQIVYIILYLGKSLVSQLLIGSTFKAALTATGVKAAASLVNGAIAVIVSIPLYFAIKKALNLTKFKTLI